MLTKALAIHIFGVSSIFTNAWIATYNMSLTIADGKDDV